MGCGRPSTGAWLTLNSARAPGDANGRPLSHAKSAFTTTYDVVRLEGREENHGSNSHKYLNLRKPGLRLRGHFLPRAK